jgi:hypothetical protein
MEALQYPSELPGAFRALIDRLQHLKVLDRHVNEIEAQIKAWHHTNEASLRLERVPGIGPLTASALVATLAHAKAFTNGRQLAAWLGLVPRQNSTGGKTTLLGMSKRGDTYLRTLLIHGARSVLYRCTVRNESSSWLFNVALDETRTSQPLHWPTRRLASRGHCLLTSESSDRQVLRSSRRHERQAFDEGNRRTSTDCAGDQAGDGGIGKTGPSKPAPAACFEHLDLLRAWSADSIRAKRDESTRRAKAECTAPARAIGGRP